MEMKKYMCPVCGRSYTVDELDKLSLCISKHKEDIAAEKDKEKKENIERLKRDNLELISKINENCKELKKLGVNASVNYSQTNSNDGAVKNIRTSNVYKSTEDYFNDFANILEKEIEKEREKNKISPNVSFYVLTLLFKYIKNENFLNSLTLILFSKKIHFKLIEQCQNPPKNLSNYESDWNNAIKPKKYKFKDHVMLNFTENFAKALLSNLTSPFSDVSSLIRKIENKFKNQTGTLNANSPEVYKSILEELYHIF